MAITYISKDYTDDNGQTFYCWVPQLIQLNPVTQSITVIFRGWKDAAALQAGKMPCNKSIGIGVTFSALGLLSPASDTQTPLITSIQSAVFSRALVDEFFIGSDVVTE